MCISLYCHCPRSLHLVKEELKAPTASDYKMKEVAVPGVSPAPRSSVLSVCVWLLEGMCTCVHTCHGTCVEEGPEDKFQESALLPPCDSRYTS